MGNNNSSHQYTDVAIIHAAEYAASQTSSHYRNVSLDYLESFLAALPDQQQDWEACEFSDIRKGDRVKRVKKNSDGTISTIEGPATFHHLTGWGTYDYYLAFREDDSQDNITLYRIPAPVVHPYPLDHPAIVVIEADGYEDTNPQVFVWTGNRYENDAWSFDADDITSWKPINPAKVIADE